MTEEIANVNNGFIFGTAEVVLLILGAVWYFLQAVAFYKLAKNYNIRYAWIAWIPIGQLYLLGDLIDNEVWGFGHANIILLVGEILIAVFNTGLLGRNIFLTILNLVLIIGYYAYYNTAYYKLYKIYEPEKYMFHFLLALLFPFLQPIFLFNMRNRKRYDYSYITR